MSGRINGGPLQLVLIASFRYLWPVTSYDGHVKSRATILVRGSTVVKYLLYYMLANSKKLIEWSKSIFSQSLFFLKSKIADFYVADFRVDAVHETLKARETEPVRSQIK